MIAWPARALSWLALLAIGCGANEPAAGVSRSPVVYGQDGRVKVYDEPGELIRSTALGNALTLMGVESVTTGSDGAVHVAELSAMAQLGLCPDERFADQPAPARCSAVLVRPDLALTAGHCTRDVPCEDMVVVRGFAYDAPGELRPLRTSDVARCKRVLHREPPRDPNGMPGLDYAWLELDRAFDAPASLVVEPAAGVVRGETAVLIGNGLGVPLKIDASGNVTEADAATGHFLASVDNYGGGSGAGVFDAAGSLLGIAVTGAADYEVTLEGCQKTRTLDEARGWYPRRSRRCRYRRHSSSCAAPAASSGAVGAQVRV